MTEQDVTRLLVEAFPGAQIAVELDGGHVNITVISADFEGLRPVACQQRVYAPLASAIAAGHMHAVNIRALTPAEAAG